MISFVIVFEALKNFGIQGAAGGLTTFLYAFSKGHYKNNLYYRKLLLEIFGGGLMATFLTHFMILAFTITTDSVYNAFALLIPYSIGLSWARIIQLVRNWITNRVERALERIDVSSGDKS